MVISVSNIMIEKKKKDENLNPMIIIMNMISLWILDDSWNEI